MVDVVNLKEPKEVIATIAGNAARVDGARTRIGPFGDQRVGTKTAHEQNALPGKIG
jgi:hypothetical protein